MRLDLWTDSITDHERIVLVKNVHQKDSEYKLLELQRISHLASQAVCFYPFPSNFSFMWTDFTALTVQLVQWNRLSFGELRLLLFF